jgi:hypothetical protein
MSRYSIKIRMGRYKDQLYFLDRAMQEIIDARHSFERIIEIEKTPIPQDCFSNRHSEERHLNQIQAMKSHYKSVIGQNLHRRLRRFQNYYNQWYKLTNG